PNHRPSRRMGGRPPRPALAVSVEHFVRNPSQRPDHHRGPASTRLGSLLRGAASGRCVLGAGDESRTRDLNAGNVALYQLSSSRVASRIIASTDLTIRPIRSSAELAVTSASRLRHPFAGKAVRLRRYHLHDGSEGDRLPLARGGGGGGAPFVFPRRADGG